MVIPRIFQVQNSVTPSCPAALCLRGTSTACSRPGSRDLCRFRKWACAAFVETASFGCSLWLNRALAAPPHVASTHGTLPGEAMWLHGHLQQGRMPPERPQSGWVMSKCPYCLAQPPAFFDRFTQVYQFLESIHLTLHTSFSMSFVPLFHAWAAVGRLLWQDSTPTAICLSL